VKIDASSLKTFNAGLHLLQKIGKDIIFEVEESVLTLRALNDTKSSFLAIEYDKNFFDDYELSTETSFSCKLMGKVCLLE
jgi:hypothetical protein